MRTCLNTKQKLTSTIPTTTNEGNIRYSTVVNGQLFQRVYSGYTRREALADFNRMVRIASAQ